MNKKLYVCYDINYTGEPIAVLVSSVDTDFSDWNKIEDNSFSVSIPMGVLPEGVRNIVYNILVAGGADVIIQ